MSDTESIEGLCMLLTVNVRHHPSCTNVPIDAIIYVNIGSLCRSVLPTYSAPQQTVSLVRGVAVRFLGRVAADNGHTNTGKQDNAITGETLFVPLVGRLNFRNAYGPGVSTRFSLSVEMSRLTRDGTAEPVSRDQILRHARGQRNIHYPCSVDHEQDWQPYPVDPYSCYM